MNLYRRLILTLAALLALGLLAADVVTYTSLRSFLYGRLDAQIDATQRLAARYLVRAAERGYPATVHNLDRLVDPDAYVLLLGRDGKILVSVPSGTPDHPSPQPVLPRSLRVQVAATALATAREPGPYRPNPNGFDLNGPPGSGVHYRAQALAVPQGTLITAITLASIDDTLGSLLRIEVLASAAAILAVSFLALWIVRRGLRPLRSMTETARAIASGDLGQRVEPLDERTEVGKLGGALNTMLSRIEMAFTEKSESESRLRQFVADASHELRTPLTSIRGYAELLRRDGFPDQGEQRRALLRVEHEAARMGGLVDDLLLLAELDQGRPLVRTRVELRRICQDVVADAGTADSGRPIRLEASVAVEVIGDPDRIAQVVHNLVRNAVIHTPVGTEITVGVVEEGGMGIIRVADRGPGLTEEQSLRVFDRFYRTDASRTGRGSGLGLAIVRAIAEASGGWARATPTPGGGATFTVGIPLCDPSGPPGQLVAPSTNAEAAPGRNASSTGASLAVVSRNSAAGSEPPTIPAPAVRRID